MSEFDLPESGHGFEADPNWVEDDLYGQHWDEPYYEDYEPSPYDGTYSEM